MQNLLEGFTGVYDALQKRLKSNSENYAISLEGQNSLRTREFCGKNSIGARDAHLPGATRGVAFSRMVQLVAILEKSLLQCITRTVLRSDQSSILAYRASDMSGTSLNLND